MSTSLRFVLNWPLMPFQICASELTCSFLPLLQFLGGEVGPKTLHVPSGDKMLIYDAAMRYQSEGTPTIILAGAEYGSGSSRDWAAKGPYLQVRKLVAKERCDVLRLCMFVNARIQSLNSENPGL